MEHILDRLSKLIRFDFINAKAINVHIKFTMRVSISHISQVICYIAKIDRKGNLRLVEIQVIQIQQ